MKWTIDVKAYAQSMTLCHRGDAPGVDAAAAACFTHECNCEARHLNSVGTEETAPPRKRGAGCSPSSTAMGRSSGVTAPQQERTFE